MRYEYKLHPVLEGDDNTEAFFNILGAEGWELVAVDNDIAYFKRQIMSIYDD